MSGHTKKLVLLMLDLIFGGYALPTFSFHVNLEFAKAARQPLSDAELMELVLARELAFHMFHGNFDAIYELICHVGASALRNKLVPDSASWANPHGADMGETIDVFRIP